MMKSKTVTVHYCDHCGKRRFFKSLMIKHEEHCTANPKRKCKMCEINGTSPKPISGARKILLKYNPHENVNEGQMFTISSLKNYHDGCPACMLSSLRLVEHNLPYSVFNFKDACREWWAYQRELRPEDFGPTALHRFIPQHA